MAYFNTLGKNEKKLTSRNTFNVINIMQKKVNSFLYSLVYLHQAMFLLRKHFIHVTSSIPLKGLHLKFVQFDASTLIKKEQQSGKCLFVEAYKEILISKSMRFLFKLFE